MNPSDHLLPCAAAEAPAARWCGSGTILSVDDEETVRAVAARMLEAFGFTVVTMPDGRSGLDLFSADPGLFAAVLMDLNMPHMGGVEAFHEMRKLQPSLRVLMMSGFNEEEVAAKFSGARLARFLQKPFTPEALCEKLQVLFSSPAR